MDFTAEWLNQLLKSIDEKLDSETKTALLATCSEACTRPWAAQAQEIRRQFPHDADTATLLNAFREVLPGGGPDIRGEGSRIFWSFSGGDCPCPVGSVTRNPAVCYCSISHVKGMLEPLLGKTLQVTLMQSRLHGDERCAFAIRVVKT